MDGKEEAMKKKMKTLKAQGKIIAAVAAVLSFVGVISWHYMRKAEASDYITVTNAGSSSFPGNYTNTYIKVRGPSPTGSGTAVSTIKFTVQQTDGVTYKNYTFSDASRELKIVTKEVSKSNPFNLEMVSDKVSTKKNSDNAWSWIDIQVKYDVPAHYQYSSISYDAPSSKYHKLISGQPGHNKKAHSVTTTFGMSAYDTGVTPFLDGSSYVRYHECTVVIDLTKKTYKIHYNANGGSIGESERTFYDGDQFTFPTPSRTGYTFKEWRRDSNDGVVLNTSWVVCSTDFYAVAQWTANTYKVSYNGNGADSGNVADETATYDSNHTFASNGYKKKGYSFVGWNSDKNATTAEYPAGRTITWKRTSNLTLYAIWSQSSYEVSFDGNGASGSKKTASLKCGVNDTLPANTFERAGYTFMGWSEDPDAVRPKYTDGQTVNSLCDAGKTYELYAVWKKTDGSFDTHNIIRDDGMFNGSIELEGQGGTGFSRDHTDSEYARIDKDGQPGYFTDRYR